MTPDPRHLPAAEPPAPQPGAPAYPAPAWWRENGEEEPAYSITVSVEQLPLSGDVRLKVASSHCDEDTPYREEAAETVCRQFERIVQYERGLLAREERSPEDTLERLEPLLCQTVLTGKTGVALIAECRRGDARRKQVWIKGVPSHVNLPWEILAERGRRLFDYQNVSLARTILPESVRPGAPCPLPQSEEVAKLRVLLVPAEPDDAVPIEWGAALSALERRLWYYRDLGLVEWDVLGSGRDPGTLRRLQQQMDRPYDVVHLLVHGRSAPEPQIALVGADGKAAWTSIEELAAVLMAGGRPPRLVLLGGCHPGEPPPGRPDSAIAYRLIEQGIPVVLSLPAGIGPPGAAAAAATMLRGVLCGDGLSRALAACRQEMTDLDALLAVLWLNPAWDQHQPVVRVHQPPKEKLIGEAARNRGAGAGEMRAPAMLARMRYVEETYGLDNEFETGLKRYYEDLVINTALRRIESHRANSQSRESVAQEIVLLELRCPALREAARAVAEAKQWVCAELLELAAQGRQRGAEGEWSAAQECYQEALRLQPRDPLVAFLFAQLRPTVRVWLRYAESRRALAIAAEFRAAGEFESALSEQQAAVKGLQEVSQRAPPELASVGEQFELCRRRLTADRQILAARRAAEQFQWSAARQHLTETQAAGQDLSAVEATDLEFVRYCEEVESRVSQALRWAEAGELPQALQALPETLSPPAPACPPPAGAEWRAAVAARWAEALDLPRRRKHWEMALRAREVLGRLQAGIVLDCPPPASDDVRLAMQLRPADPDAVARVREQIAGGVPEDLVAWLAGQLQADAAVFFAIQDEWPLALEAVERMGGRLEGRAAVRHRLAVVGLERMLSQSPGGPLDPDAERLWIDTIESWCDLIERRDYWRNWSQQYTPDGEPWEAARLRRFGDGLRRRLADGLGPCPQASQLLRRVGRFQRGSPALERQVLRLCLDLAQEAIPRQAWPSVAAFWEAAFRHTDRDDLVADAARAIVDAAVTWSESWLAAGEHAAACQLWTVAAQALEGTDRLPLARRARARMHFEAGKAALKRHFGEWPRLAYQEMRQAYNLASSEVTHQAVVLALLANAHTDDDRDASLRYRQAAQHLLDEGLQRWPYSMPLRRLVPVAAAEDLWQQPDFWEMLAEVTQKGAIPADASVVTLRQQGLEALHRGDVFEAAFCLVHALWLGDGEALPVVPPALSRLAEALTAPLPEGPDYWRLGHGLRWADRALKICPDADPLLEARARLQQALSDFSPAAAPADHPQDPAV